MLNIYNIKVNGDDITFDIVKTIKTKIIRTSYSTTKQTYEQLISDLSNITTTEKGLALNIIHTYIMCGI